MVQCFHPGGLEPSVIARRAGEGVAKASRRKVLVIDDEIPLLEVIKKNLEIEGYETLTEMSGETGFVSAVVEQPDVIILDVMMPVVDGWEICRRLREEPRTRYIPIIMLTALDQTQDIVKGLSMGADDYIAKPFRNEELFARIKTVLKKANKGLVLDPLTNLPGKHQIYEETRTRMEQRGKFFAFMYVDISNLRAINAIFGIQQGDDLIKVTAKALEESIIPESEFLGYMGEDDFVILTVPIRVHHIFDAASERFDRYYAGLFADESGKLPDTGGPVKLAASVVTNETRQFGDALQIKNIALEVLKHSREIPDHHVAFLKDHPL